MVVFSSPCNPTGLVYSRSELEAFAQILSRFNNLYIISDEIYEHINFTGEKTSFATLDGMFEKTITVNGFGKCFAMTGWRVGYLAAPKWIADGCIKLQGHLTSANCSISQRAAYAAITGEMNPTIKMVSEYKKRRDLVYPQLKSIPGINVNFPQGAFYFFPDVSKLYGRYGNGLELKSSNDFCAFLLEKANVAVVPGDAFGNDNCIRISYATSADNLNESLKRIKKVISALNA